MELKAKTYRVLSAKLRVQRGPGREDLEVARPVVQTAKGEPKRDGRGNVTYTDGDGAPGSAAPTLVTFDEHCQVNIGQLIRFGAIAEVYPQRAQRDTEGTGTAKGAGKGARSSHSEAGAAEAPPQVPDVAGPGGDQEAIQHG